MRSLVFQPEGGETEPESRCRVNWDIKLEQVLGAFSGVPACLLRVVFQKRCGTLDQQRAQTRSATLVPVRGFCAMPRSRYEARCLALNMQLAAGRSVSRARIERSEEGQQVWMPVEEGAASP